MTVFNDIRSALEQQVITASGFPSSSNRAWENVRLDPDKDTTWARMTLIPSATRPNTIGNNYQQLYQGLFQVDIFVPEGNGAAAADALADAVRDVFTVTTQLTVNSTTIRIQYSERGQGLMDSPFYQVPVTVAWYTYRS